jgi:hypothetical protein
VSTSFVGKFSSLDCSQSVVVEDDGRVAYAYLLDADGHIVGDVWLYNRCAAPSEPEWSDRERAPFVNPAAYVIDSGEFSPPPKLDDVAVEWAREGSAYKATVLIRRQVAALLMDGAKPGWSSLAALDGPLAKAMLPK